jgi:hypothetical protein
MENVSTPSVSAVPASGSVPMLCPQCHQPVPAGAYFCPNCGKKLSDPPLSKSIGAQIWIYAFSIILPIICYLAIGYWPAVKYFKSDDPETKQIGIIAFALIIISTFVTFWLAAVWVNSAVQQAVNSVGNLGGY